MMRYLILSFFLFRYRCAYVCTDPSLGMWVSAKRETGTSPPPELSHSSSPHVMDHQEILAVHSLLHLIYHRNKNQHRRAKWWKWLSALKRTALDLGSTESVTNASAYRQHLASHLVPRCYLYVGSTLEAPSIRLISGDQTDLASAFSTVVADNQFGTLGIVLLAALARLGKATGVELGIDARVSPATERVIAVTSIEEDRGERVSRDQAEALPEPSEAPLSKEVARPLKSKPRDQHSKKASKRKKNAIDDLFSGLL